jgi:hypothetical protein
MDTHAQTAERLSWPHRAASCVFGVIKRELRRRSTIETVIGHTKTDSHLGRCYQGVSEGNAANELRAIKSPRSHSVLRSLLSYLALDVAAHPGTTCLV